MMPGNNRLEIRLYKDAVHFYIRHIKDGKFNTYERVIYFKRRHFYKIKKLLEKYEEQHGNLIKVGEAGLSSGVSSWVQDSKNNWPV